MLNLTDEEKKVIMVHFLNAIENNFDYIVDIITDDFEVEMSTDSKAIDILVAHELYDEDYGGLKLCEESYQMARECIISAFKQFKSEGE